MKSEAVSQVPMLEFTKIPNKGVKMNKELVAKELLAIAGELRATVFPSQNALRDYMREHPDSNRGKHKVNYKEWKRKYRKNAADITAAWKQGEGTIKFVIGDLVRIGTRRNVYKVAGVRLEYAVYDEKRTYVETFDHDSIGQKFLPVNWRFVNLSGAGTKKDGYGAIGDKVKVLSKHSQRAIEGEEYAIGLIHESYYLQGVNTSKNISNIEYNLLEPADAEPRDNKDRTAIEALMDEYGVVGSYVIENYGRTDHLGKIMAISDNGRIKVGLFPVGKYHGQEEYTPDTTSVKEVKLYTPKLSSGAWHWSGGYGYLRPYKGEKTMESLLD